ncbi:hypothetical protein P5673_022752 [Acropora cervicornis]|uniref:Uncharacterized protein n=1 Tax=Acropora cervicornis TaxID=6130 RepID=A0AAD9Q7B1_ACRCE|nr:hypothetical protein P5673_022752 [Acropora cervicornis]
MSVGVDSLLISGIRESSSGVSWHAVVINMLKTTGAFSISKTAEIACVYSAVSVYALPAWVGDGHCLFSHALTNSINIFRVALKNTHNSLDNPPSPPRNTKKPTTRIYNNQIVKQIDE